MIDARGRSCPEPVIMIRNAMKSKESRYQMLADSRVCVENVTRYAEHEGYRVTVTDQEDDYLLTTKLFCGYCGAYLCGESGTSRTGVVHHYYKCISVKKKRTNCHKKSVRKDWIEDIVVSETMKMLMNDAAVEAIVSMVMALQDQENVNLPLYEKELRETKINIQNMLNAIQQGILTRSTKERLEELEAARDDLENKIACEKLAKPRISEEFITFWLHRFRKLDVTQNHTGRC